MPVPATTRLYDFTVTFVSLDGMRNDVPLQAAYFVEDHSYTLFKDKWHGVVDAFRTDSVIRIKRGTAVVDG